MTKTAMALTLAIGTGCKAEETVETHSRIEYLEVECRDDATVPLVLKDVRVISVIGRVEEEWMVPVGWKSSVDGRLQVNDCQNEVAVWYVYR